MDAVQRAAKSTVASLFAARARVHPGRVALDDGTRALTYGEVLERSARLAGFLRGRGVQRGDRLAVLSENRLEYLEVHLAAARIGAITACQSWRLAPAELRHCLELVEPKVTFASPLHAEKLAADLVLGDAYEAALAAATPAPIDDAVDPEDPLIILYTSGTTGLPKGAVLSHRAEIVRNLTMRAELGLASDDDTVAWPPLYHMGATEWSLGTLMSGGAVYVLPGYDAARLADIVATKKLGWLLLMPGMIASFAEELRRRAIVPRGIKIAGVMADLVPPHELAEITTLLRAPYGNTFGATETGCPPCSSNLIPIGVVPERLSKEQSPYCEVRLVDADGDDVPDGTPGELWMRGPTLFSGYFRNPEANAASFAGGWFHMGDVFQRNADGTLDFVDRVKYLIKSGGENVYPAEIERVLLADPRVAEAAVVRRPDAKWGEVPVAFVARSDAALTAEELYARCRAELAGYKQPKDIVFIALEEFPRSASGKVQRHELEKLEKLEKREKRP
ncbi:MAG: AMP-binding protein [Labilithrix sp.]|nr:AMP-binding protein [Labilithrix sp.]MCW5814253.1 AMP-binding protein [Labilithrix sp.]